MNRINKIGALAGLALFILGALAIFGEIPLPTTTIGGLTLFGAGVAVIAIFFAFDSGEQLNRLKRGEVNEKIAMIYGYTITVSGNANITDEFRNYLTAKIAYDIRSMASMGKLDKEISGQVERASDSLLWEMLQKGYYTTEVANELGKILYQ